MSLPEWSPEFSVGSKTLDDQHKGILRVCANIQNLTKSDPDYLEKLHIALNDMSIYASNHFREEERILKEIQYPELAIQRVEHEKYQELLNELLMDAVEGNADADKMSKFLEDWWIDHILNSDMKYKSYLVQPS